MSKLNRVAEDDPLRCQAIFRNGQCPYGACQDSKYCVMHGGHSGLLNGKKRATHDYKIQLWQDRVDELVDSSHIKNLRGEIGILRMTLEQILNQVKTPAQFPIFSDKIQSVARDLKGLVESCQKIEERNKELLSKTEVFNIADAVIALVSEYITDPDQLAEAGDKLHDIIIGVASR